MAGPSAEDQYEFKELSSEKIRQIIVWRTEVHDSRTQCICSRPTMIQNSTTLSETETSSEYIYRFIDENTDEISSIDYDYDRDHDQDQDQGKGKAVDRGGLQIGESSSTALESLFQESIDIPLYGEMFVSDGDPCPMCATPVNEGVEFVPVGPRGDSAIICTNASARSVVSVDRLSDAISYRRYKTPTKSWFEKVKKPAKKIKRAVTTEREKSKRKLILKPLRRLLRRKASTGSNSSGPLTVRPRATEMYHTVPDAVPPGTAGSVETLLSGLSDSDDDDHHNKRGKPKLTIDESAARLRRAQRLLEKQKQKRNSDSKD
ncbi:hypothetical protein F5B19DRAFT_470854 [Rostrohypoxylon terebratum]|nr:hypothetical protein F5B19DRAFT_470854 [Rostrohypoxylon terebratum]